MVCIPHRIIVFFKNVDVSKWVTIYENQSLKEHGYIHTVDGTNFGVKSIDRNNTFQWSHSIYDIMDVMSASTVYIKKI